ncbi:MAG: 30S ribosomal protein S17 [Candidatus Saganbacteria bacterium]|nr:30S ribosomal protein S17 [Candidatus Saganbacteria bacterium]
MDRGKRKIRTGVVISNRMQKTVVVETERVFRHPLVKKVVRANRRLKAHDEQNVCQPGDIVEVMETRPLSRDKRWRVIKVVGKGKLSLHERPKKHDASEKPAEAGKEAELDPTA